MGDDRGARLVASCWSMTIASGILLALRIYCKLWRGRGLWWDDHLLLGSWSALLIAGSINTYLVSLGFGQHKWTISEDNLKIINLDTILVAAFGIIATTTSKTSFAMTLYRISADAWMKYFLIFVIVTINISMNLVWIFGFAKCTPIQRVWDKTVPGTCWNTYHLTKYQLFAAYYSAILDFVLALLPWKILMGMTMRLREKLGVAIAMSLGAIAGITGIVKAVLVVHMTSPDITYDRVDLTIWTLVEPAASIMAVSIPILRMLYRELKSSQRSYFRNRPLTNPQERGSGNSKPPSDGHRSRGFGYNPRYGRNSVVIMSTPGWEESDEALQNPDNTQRDPPLAHNGVIKTEEIRIHHERLSTYAEQNSVELKSIQLADRHTETTK